MPYVITTHELDETSGLPTPPMSRPITVDTLDEAREAAQHILAPFDAAAIPAPDDDLNDYSRAYFSACADMECMDESGGTIGPLPDGTVIEVRPDNTNNV